MMPKLRDFQFLFLIPVLAKLQVIRPPGGEGKGGGGCCCPFVIKKCRKFQKPKTNFSGLEFAEKDRGSKWLSL